MSPRSAKQINTIRKEKKNLILETALELFAENGFHATSISQIAKKAKISKGLTYNYFESKKEILDEILRVGFDSIYSNFDLNQDGVLTEEEFIWFIKQSFRIMRENNRFWKLYFSLLFQPKVAESFQNDYSETSKNLYSKLFQFVVGKGSTNPESDVIVITALLKGAYITTVSAPDYFPPEKMELTIIEALLTILNNQKINMV